MTLELLLVELLVGGVTGCCELVLALEFGLGLLVAGGKWLSPAELSLG